MSTNVSSTQSTISTNATTGANFWESFQSGTGGATASSTLTPEINISTVRKTVEASFQVITAKSASLLSLSKAKALDACVEMRQQIQTIIESLEVILNPIQQKIEKEQRKLVRSQERHTTLYQSLKTQKAARKARREELNQKVSVLSRKELSDLLFGQTTGLFINPDLIKLDDESTVLAQLENDVDQIKSEVSLISEEINKAGGDLTALRSIQTSLKGMLIKHKFLSNDVEVIQTCIDYGLLTRDDITNFETSLKSCKQSFDVLTLL